MTSAVHHIRGSVRLTNGTSITVRYNALARQNPERAEALFDAAVENAKDRYDYLTRLTALYGQD